jgi:hypothetical protein
MKEKDVKRTLPAPAGIRPGRHNED